MSGSRYHFRGRVRFGKTLETRDLKGSLVTGGPESSAAVSGACPHSAHLEEASKKDRGSSLQVSTSRHLWSVPACFRPFTVINSLALNVCPSPLCALWAVSLMCIPRSAVTRSGAMELHCRYWYSSPELTSWKHQSAPAAAGGGGWGVAACPHCPPPLASFPGLAGPFCKSS